MSPSKESEQKMAQTYPLRCWGSTVATSIISILPSEFQSMFILLVPGSTSHSLFGMLQCVH